MNRSSAPTVLTVGLILVCLAGFALCVEATALDADRVAGTAKRMLDAQPVEAPMRARVGAALSASLPPGAPIDAAGIQRATGDVLHQPAFVAAFARALDDVYRHTFDGRTDPIVLDPTQVRTAILAALATVDPALPGLVSPSATPAVAVDVDAIPNLDGWPDPVGIFARVAGLVGVALVVLALALSEHRARAVARIGRWAIVSGLGILVTFWLVPAYVFPLVGGWTEVAGVVMAASRALVIPGISVTLVGVVLAVGANRVIALERTHTLAVVPKAPMRHVTPADRSWQSQPRV